MSFPQKVKSTLWAIVDNMACNTACFVKKPKKDFTRNRKLGFAQLIRFFLSMESGCINHELLKYFYFLPDEIPSASSFIQQRAKLLPEAFRHVLTQFNLRFPAKGLWGKYSLIAVDGCEFNIARNPGDPSTFHPTSGRSKGASTLSIPFLCMTCFPRGFWMWFSSRENSKMNFSLSASSLTAIFMAVSQSSWLTGGFPAITSLHMPLKKAVSLPSAPKTST